MTYDLGKSKVVLIKSTLINHVTKFVDGRYMFIYTYPHDKIDLNIPPNTWVKLVGC